MSVPIISFRAALKVFPAAGKRPEVRAVDGVTFDILAGEIFGVIGHSGAGKSTLVRLINALEKPTAGSVIVDGIDLGGLSESKLRPMRAGIGMIFQQFNLLQSRTVAGNVAYPLEVAGWPRARRRKRVAELLEYVGLSDKAKARPRQLSGGQRQRVGIARALAASPRILLADEATSALDPETTRDVLELLKRINRELGVTVVVITHAMSLVRHVCDRVAVMAEGKIAEIGDTYSVFTSPSAEVTKRLVETALSDRPSASMLERLRTQHPGRLITVGVHDNAAPASVSPSAEIFGLLRQYNVDATVIYGTITEIGERPFGSLTIEITSDPGNLSAIDRAVNALAAIAPVADHGAVIAALPTFTGRQLLSGLPAAPAIYTPSGEEPQ
ncbi:MAG: methionine ABC transporter ATP-binding protein [Promicromonosporaceae bacterium]|nr:methionine ABC transporter ATP-binding protein [Promicromonosporaceae bacterium]